MEKKQAMEFLMTLFPGKTVSVQETTWYHCSTKKIADPEYVVSAHCVKKETDCFLGYGKTWGRAIGDLIEKTSEQEQF